MFQSCAHDLNREFWTLSPKSTSKDACVALFCFALHKRVGKIHVNYNAHCATHIIQINKYVCERRSISQNSINRWMFSRMITVRFWILIREIKTNLKEKFVVKEEKCCGWAYFCSQSLGTCYSIIGIPFEPYLCYGMSLAHQRIR